MSKSVIANLSAILGLDRSLIITLIGRFWSVFAGLIILLAIVKYLSPETQGYYYTFGSLIGLQVLVELGLNFAIVQFASHEMAHLNWQPNNTVSGSEVAKSRLQSLFLFSMTWFGVAVLLMISILLPAGIYFFSDAKNTLSNDVYIPWALLVIFTAINLFIGAFNAIIEGCGRVAQVAALRLCQSVASTATVLIFLVNGGGLYALAFGSIALCVVGIIWILRYYFSFIVDLRKHNSELPGLNWRSEIWPFQWKIALSWLSGYIVFQIFSPLLFKTHGSIAAGQMGMSLQIFAAMNGAAMAWISTKAPLYGQLIATDQRQKLDAIFSRSLIQSSVFLGIGIIFVWVSVYYLHLQRYEYVNRIVSLPLFSILCMVCLANHIVFAQASYLRAHKEEPFLVVSLASAALTMILAFALIPKFSLAGAVYSYAIPAVFCGLIIGSTIFYIKKRQWNSKEFKRHQ